MLFEKAKINQKEAGDDQFLTDEAICELVIGCGSTLVEWYKI